MTSIRRFLLLSILPLTAGILAICATFSYYAIRNDINQVFDAQLIEMSHNIQRYLQQYAIEDFTTDVSPETFTTRNAVLHERPFNISEMEHPYASRRVYQVWNTDGHLLARDSMSPTFPLSTMEPGLSQNNLGPHTWYTHTLVDDDTSVIYIAAQRGDIRETLAQNIALKNMLPFLLFFPVLTIYIYLAIGRAFKPTKQLADELNDRAYDNLEPLTANKVPSEIAPLITAINALFSRLNNAYEREKRFTADAAHELRTPLAASKTMVQLAKNSHNVTDCHSILNDAEKGVDRCTHVVQQLAILNSIKPEQLLYDRVEINLSEIAQQIINEMRAMIAAKKIEFHCNIPNNLFMSANLASIQILLRNLIDNAVRYSPTNTQAYINVTKTKNNIRLEVNDSGPGIPDEMHERVFERFYRNIDAKEDGSGLGLSIVAQICKLYNAKITLGKNAKGFGLGFCIDFPITGPENV